MSPHTCSLHFAEVQAHLFDGKIHLKGSNLLSKDKQVFNLEQLPINWTLQHKYNTYNCLAEMCFIQETADHILLIQEIKGMVTELKMSLLTD